MNTKKIASLVNSNFIYKDVIGQSICLGDILAISGTKLKRGYVYSITEKNIKAYDIDKLIENKLVSAKTYLHTKYHTLNITKMFSKQDIRDIETKIKKIRDTHDTTLSKEYFILYLLYKKDEYGLYVAQTYGNLKISNCKAIEKIAKKYPGYEYIPYCKNDKFEKNYRISDIKFFSWRNGILECFNTSFMNRTFTLTDKFIVIKKDTGFWRFFIHKNEHGYCNNQLNCYFLKNDIINDIANKELDPAYSNDDDKSRFLGYGAYFNRAHILNCLNNFLQSDLI